MWIVHELAFFASVAYYIVISRIPSMSIYKVQKVRVSTSLLRSLSLISTLTNDTWWYRRIATLPMTC